MLGNTDLREALPARQPPELGGLSSYCIIEIPDKAARKSKLAVSATFHTRNVPCETTFQDLLPKRTFVPEASILPDPNSRLLWPACMVVPASTGPLRGGFWL
jgi:hypothetical protein